MNFANILSEQLTKPLCYVYTMPDSSFVWVYYEQRRHRTGTSCSHTSNIIIALNFFTCLRKHGKFRFASWNCFYRASKSGRNTDMEGWKRIGKFPPRFVFIFIYLFMLLIAAFIWQARIGCYVNGLIDVKEKLKILKSFLTTQAEIKPSCHHVSWGEIVQILPQKHSNNT